MSAQPVPALELGHIEELSRGAGEPEWLLARRREAGAMLDPLVLPDRSRHLWRYTGPRRFLPATDPTAGGPVEVGPAWRIDDTLTAAALIGGGALRVVELDDAARDAGLEVANLHLSAPQELLGSLVPATRSFVEAINAAAWRGGVLVRVPPGLALEQPIRLRILAGGLSVPRVLVVVGAGSSCEIVEGHMGGGEGDLTLGVSEVFVEEGASLRYSIVQRWQPGSSGHLTARARLAAGSHLQLSLASFGGSAFKADVGAILAGEGAQSEMYGVAMGGDLQHFDHHTEHIHTSGHTRSNLDFKVALTGAARSAYTGLIRIEPEAGDSEAYQENRNLLLSPDARAESIPELEILTDDVKCSHGATVAPLDPEQLFYLASRGLPRSQAMRVIVYGFFDQTLGRLPQSTRERIEAMVASRLHSE
jgi:Fe-S cluster assembly protein SufD